MKSYKDWKINEEEDLRGIFPSMKPMPSQARMPLDKLAGLDLEELKDPQKKAQMLVRFFNLLYEDPIDQNDIPYLRRTLMKLMAQTHGSPQQEETPTMGENVEPEAPEQDMLVNRQIEFLFNKLSDLISKKSPAVQIPTIQSMISRLSGNLNANKMGMLKRSTMGTIRGLGSA